MLQESEAEEAALPGAFCARLGAVQFALDRVGAAAIVPHVMGDRVPIWTFNFGRIDARVQRIGNEGLALGVGRVLVRYRSVVAEAAVDLVATHIIGSTTFEAVLGFVDARVGTLAVRAGILVLAVRQLAAGRSARRPVLFFDVGGAVLRHPIATLFHIAVTCLFTANCGGIGNGIDA